MKAGYRNWLTVQNTLLVNWIIIVKIESLWNQISQEKRAKTILKIITSDALISMCIRWYSIKCIMYEMLFIGKISSVKSMSSWSFMCRNTASWQPLSGWSYTPNEWLQKSVFF